VSRNALVLANARHAARQTTMNDTPWSVTGGPLSWTWTHAGFTEQSMDEQRTLDELRDLGSGRLAPDGVVLLYRQAFAAFGTRALWNWRQLETPTITQALAIAEPLRNEGDWAARAMAVQIEAACRAAL
jgi:hypothetical protein